MSRWRGCWIWAGRSAIRLDTITFPQLDPAGFDRRVLFRRTFELDAVPTAAAARVTADSRYMLWVNGAEVARGPVRDNPRRLHYDTVDVVEHLRPGRNLFAALVRFYGHPMPWWMPAPPNYTLGAGAFVLEADLADAGWIATDDTWRAQTASAWRAGRVSGDIGAGLPEIFDARELDPEWREVEFDDTTWDRATVIRPVHIGTQGFLPPPTSPYGALLPRPVLPLVGDVCAATVVDDARVTGAPDELDPVAQVDRDSRTDRVDAGPVRLLTLDFGGVVSGVLRLEVDTPAGTVIDASCAEVLDRHGRLARLGQHTGFRYIARGRDDAFEPTDLVGTRLVRLSVRGETRRVELSLREQHRPRPPGAWFECSDPLLERVYAVGLRTVDLCAHDAYVDCPTREQRAWTGDAVVHQMVDLATNPDWSLARWHPQLTASPRPDGMLPMAVAGDFEWADTTIIPDWPLHWIRSVHNLYRYTGDQDLVADLLGPAEGVLRWFVPFQGTDGLLHDVTDWVLIDWSSVHVAGTSSALNALWARALRDFAEMSEWLGDGSRAAWARDRWRRVAEGFDAFWDPSREVYVDHVLDGARQRPMSQHGNVAAICAGLVPDERVAALVVRVTDRPRLVRRSWVMDQMTPDRDHEGATFSLATPPPPPDWDVDTEIIEAQPFFRYVVHDALAAAGRSDLVADACRDWRVFLERGETTWPETWLGGTHCHGWSSTPTRDLVVRTLGIEPAEPGFGRVRVAPRLGDLDWAAGAAPTPHGLVTVRAEGDHVEVDSPMPYELA